MSHATIFIENFILSPGRSPICLLYCGATRAQVHPDSGEVFSAYKELVKGLWIIFMFFKKGNLVLSVSFVVRYAQTVILATCLPVIRMWCIVDSVACCCISCQFLGHMDILFGYCIMEFDIQVSNTVTLFSILHIYISVKKIDQHCQKLSSVVETVVRVPNNGNNGP